MCEEGFMSATSAWTAIFAERLPQRISHATMRVVILTSRSSQKQQRRRRVVERRLRVAAQRPFTTMVSILTGLLFQRRHHITSDPRIMQSELACASSRNSMIVASTRKMQAPEKVDVQGVDMQWILPFRFLTSLLRRCGGWFANHAPVIVTWDHRAICKYSPFS